MKRFLTLAIITMLATGTALIFGLGSQPQSKPSSATAATLAVEPLPSQPAVFVDVTKQMPLSVQPIGVTPAISIDAQPRDAYSSTVQPAATTNLYFRR